MKTPNRDKTLMTVAAALLLAAPCARAADNTGTGGTITYTDASGLNPTQPLFSNPFSPGLRTALLPLMRTNREKQFSSN